VHRKHALRTCLALSLMAAAIAAPGVGDAQSPEPAGRKAVVVEVRDGFHWADAGVGAAAALATVAIAAGGVAVVREKRGRS
jgi:hypothetical protein